MSGRMIGLAVCVVLASAVASQGAFETAGVFDPDDAPHHNQVDQEAVYDGHTGNAGPANVMTLATFQAAIDRAFAQDAGGVDAIIITDVPD